MEDWHHGAVFDRDGMALRLPRRGVIGERPPSTKALLEPRPDLGWGSFLRLFSQTCTNGARRFWS
jgi:hypothetical protein